VPTPAEEPPAQEDSDLSRAARALKIDTLRTTDANAARCRATIAGAAPDALVVAGFPHLLSPDVLKLAKNGGLNLHPGKLPEERGPSPLFWALREGKTQLDFTVHMLDAGEDTGDIISAGAVPFRPGTPGLDILTGCARAAAPQLVRALRGLLEGDLVRTPQSKSSAARRSRPTFRDGRIDATKSAEAVFTFAGGCAATYSIFVEVAGDRFFIRRAISYDPEAALAFEYALTGDRLLLRCNPGIVELELKEQGALFSAEYEEGDAGV
jgi:methionyl-tRNA formyltransferase